MATKKSQRIAILVIIITLVIGTLGGFLVMVLAPKNQAADQARFEKLAAEFQKENGVYQEKVAARDKKVADELSKKYYGEFKKYQSHPSGFEADSIKELKTADLKRGSGEEIKDDTPFAAYYILWLADGKIKEQSAVDGKLNPPLEVADGLKDAMLVDGWKEGLLGMKVGGVRELSIPSDKGYGKEGNDTIPGDTPLKFIVMTIPLPDKGEEIPEPQVSDELKRLYQNIYKVKL